MNAVTRLVASFVLLSSQWSAVTCAELHGQREQAVADAATFGARVVNIVDGDTVDVRRGDGAVVRVRVHGIDAPERGRPFSLVATRFTRSMVFDQDVRISVRDHDKYGRLVGRVLVGDQNLGEELVSAGLAWQFCRYSDDPRLAELERAARQARRGIWQYGDIGPKTPCRTTDDAH